MKITLWRVAKRLSYIEDGRGLKVKFLPNQTRLSGLLYTATLLHISVTQIAWHL